MFPWRRSDRQEEPVKFSFLFFKAFRNFEFCFKKGVLRDKIVYRLSKGTNQRRGVEQGRRERRLILNHAITHVTNRSKKCREILG